VLQWRGGSETQRTHLDIGIGAGEIRSRGVRQSRVGPGQYTRHGQEASNKQLANNQKYKYKKKAKQSIYTHHSHNHAYRAPISTLNTETPPIRIIS